jgi:hypothetical protein
MPPYGELPGRYSIIIDLLRCGPVVDRRYEGKSAWSSSKGSHSKYFVLQRCQIANITMNENKWTTKISMRKTVISHQTETQHMRTSLNSPTRSRLRLAWVSRSNSFASRGALGNVNEACVIRIG